MNSIEKIHNTMINDTNLTNISVKQYLNQLMASSAKQISKLNQDSIHYKEFYNNISNIIKSNANVEDVKHQTSIYLDKLKQSVPQIETNTILEHPIVKQAQNTISTVGTKAQDLISNALKQVTGGKLHKRRSLKKKRRKYKKRRNTKSRLSKKTRTKKRTHTRKRHNK